MSNKKKYKKPEIRQVNDRVKFYPCDGLACRRQCAVTMTVSEWEQYRCHHTTDPEHAVSKFDPEHHIQVAEVLGIRKEAEDAER